MFWHVWLLPSIAYNYTGSYRYFAIEIAEVDFAEAVQWQSSATGVSRVTKTAVLPRQPVSTGTSLGSKSPALLEPWTRPHYLPPTVECLQTRPQKHRYLVFCSLFPHSGVSWFIFADFESFISHTHGACEICMHQYVSRLSEVILISCYLSGYSSIVIHPDWHHFQHHFQRTYSWPNRIPNWIPSPPFESPMTWRDDPTASAKSDGIDETDDVDTWIYDDIWWYIVTYYIYISFIYLFI